MNPPKQTFSLSLWLSCSTFLNGSIISVSETGLGGDTAAIIAQDFREDALSFSDRAHQHNGAAFNGTTLSTNGSTVVALPDYLVGADYIRFANNVRENSPYSAVITTDVTSDFYLLIDNRLNGPAGSTGSLNSSDPVLGGTLQWVIDGGWERVNTGISPGGQPDYTGVDEGGDGTGAGQRLNQFYAVYKHPSSSTSITVQSNGIGGSNMLSLVAVEAGGAVGPDSDNDGLPDLWENEFFGSLAQADSGDFDNDGLTNLQEYNLGVDPTDRDSDDDGLEDGPEVNLYETDPADSDSDDDSLNDGEEISLYETDPNDPDSDDDSLSDGNEVMVYGTKPILADTDDDGFNDAVELTNGSDPNNAASLPDFSEIDGVIINEFMASNGSSHLDEDGEASDWIELWNPENTAIDITGWYLSDDPLNLSKWEIPVQTIGPNQYLVIFASGKDRALAGSELHTDFQLSKTEGSFLALSRSDGLGGVEVVNSFDTYAEQFQDVSFGFYGEIEPLPSGYFQNPTPGAPNDQSAVAGFVSDTRFSVDRGFYDAAFEVVISSDTPGASIIYTTDGTLPSESPPNGVRVDPLSLITPPSAAVTISTTTNLRAIAVRTGFEPTDVDTHTYLFRSDVLKQSNATVPAHVNWGHAGPDFGMDPDIVNHTNPEVRPTTDDFLRVPTLSLTMNWNEMFGSGGIYIAGESVERATSIEYINPDSDLIEPNKAKGFQIDGTVQIAGGSSTGRWKSDKLSMRLKFDSDLRYALFGKDRADRFDTLVIDNRLNNVWHYNPGSSAGPSQAARAQYTHDQFPADLHTLMGGLSPEGHHCLLYINGVLWGVTELHERPDDNFVAEYLGGDNSDYDVVKHRTSTVVAGSNRNYLAMLRLSRQNMTVQSNYEAVAAVLDVDNFIAYMIANYYVGNTDWAHQNWYASYGRDVPGGKWFYHSWDPEHCLESTTQNVTGRDDSGGPTEVFHNLIANPEFRMRFADAVHRHFHHNGVLTPENAAKAYMRRADAVDYVTRLESARWGDNGNTRVNNPYTRLDWLRVRNQLLGTVSGSAWANYFPSRTGIVLNQFLSRGWYPSTDAPEFVQHGGNVPAGFDLAMTSADGGTIYYTTDGTDPRVALSEAVAPTAATYSGALKLTESATYQARVLRAGQWSALTQAEFIVDAVPADATNLVVSEINYRPGELTPEEIAQGFAARSDFEFLELRNTHPTEKIDLTGVAFTAGVDFDFESGGLIKELAPGESLLLVNNLAAFEYRYGTGLPVAGVFENATQLANSGETLTLIGADLETIQSFRFNDKAPWPTAPDGNGYTLTLINPQNHPDPSLPSSWRASVLLGGSPGADDTDSYTTWASSFGNLSATEDSDGDGLVNYLEYAMGTSPLVRNPSHATLVWNDDYSAVSFPRSKAGEAVVLGVEFSEDLATWVSGEIISVADTEDGRELLTVVPPAANLAAQKRFVRLKVSSTSP